MWKSHIKAKYDRLYQCNDDKPAGSRRKKHSADKQMPKPLVANYADL